MADTDTSFVTNEDCHDCGKVVGYCEKCGNYWHIDGVSECFLHGSMCKCDTGKVGDDEKGCRMSEDLWMNEQNKEVTRIIKALQETTVLLERLEDVVDLTKGSSKKLKSAIKRAKRALEGVR